MKKIIILLLYCGVLISMVGGGGNTAPPSTESSSSISLKIIMTETPHTTAIEKEKEKETVPIESQEQASEPTATAPTTTVKPAKEMNHSEATNTSEEKAVSQVMETVTSTTSQPTEIETTMTEPIKEITLEPETPQPEFDIHYWITYAKGYAVSVGLILDSNAASCWDNPIGANSRCIYLERDIKSRLNRYSTDEDITNVWIWEEPVGNDCYDIYIGYA